MALVRKLSAVRREKRRVRDGLLANQAYLAEGLWVLTEPSIARHVNHGPMPASLSATKGLSGVKGGMARSAVRKALYLGVPPLFVRTKRQTDFQTEGQLSDFTLLIVAKSGDTVLMDGAQQHVLKVSDKARLTSEQMNVRERLAKFVTLPAAQYFNDGKMVLEPFVRGDVFAKLSAADRTAIFSVLLERYVALTLADRSRARSDYWSSAVRAARALPLPAGAHDALERGAKALCERLTQLEFTPAHGDLSGSNILQTAEGPVPYDLEDCALLPAFYDLYFLAHQEWQCGRVESWEQLGEPATWNTMRETLGGDVDRQTWLWGMFLCELFEWKNKVGGAELTASVLANWWAPLSGVLNLDEGQDGPRVSVA